MTENYFFYGLVSASVVVTLAYLNKATGRQIVPGAQGKYLLRLHKLYYIVGLISVAVGGIQGRVRGLPAFRLGAAELRARA